MKNTRTKKEKREAFIKAYKTIGMILSASGFLTFLISVSVILRNGYLAFVPAIIGLAVTAIGAYMINDYNGYCTEHNIDDIV